MFRWYVCEAERPRDCAAVILTLADEQQLANVVHETSAGNIM